MSHEEAEEHHDNDREHRLKAWMLTGNDWPRHVALF